MILQAAWTHLKDADTPAARWQVLRAAAADLGFCRVRMELDEFEFQESLDDCASEPLWTVNIPLNGRGRVELAHRFQHDAAALSVAPLTDLLYRSLGLESGQRAADLGPQRASRWALVTGVDAEDPPFATTAKDGAPAKAAPDSGPQLGSREAKGPPMPVGVPIRSAPNFSLGPIRKESL
jgi:hypothetical protein